MTTPTHITVRHMATAADWQFAIDQAQHEGWNPGCHDAATFQQAAPHDFFIALDGDQPIGCASAILYGNHFAFFGFYIVIEAYRGQGHGWAITQQRRQHAQGRNLGLDGVVDKVTTYQKIGFQTAHRQLRFQWTEPPITDLPPPVKQITALKDTSFDALVAYDQAHFPAPRQHFLQTWITQTDAYGYAWVEDQTICGYIVMRPCNKGYKVGPLFADNEQIADDLWLAAAQQSQGQLMMIDIPEPNTAAINWAKRYQLDFVFETNRMYTQTPPPLPLQQIFGITSFESG